MEKKAEVPGSGPLGKLLVAALIAAAVFGVAGFFILPPVMKSVMTDKLSGALKREVSVEDVRVNPFALSVVVGGLEVKQKTGEGTFASVDELYVNLESLSALKRSVIISELRVVRPHISITRNEDNSYNFSDLLEAGPDAGKKEGSSPLGFSVNNIQITGGSVDFDDRPMSARHELRDLNAGIPLLSNMGYHGETFVTPSFSAVINGTPVELAGRTKPFSKSLETEFDVEFTDFDIPHYLAYVPAKMNFFVVSGYLDADAKVSYVQYSDGGKPSLKLTGYAALKKLEVKDKDGAAVLDIPRFEVSVTPSDLLAGTLRLDQVILDSPRVHVARDKSGAMNLARLVPASESGKKTAGEGGPQKSPDSTFTLSVNFLRLVSGRVEFEDDSVAGPFRAVLYPVDVNVVNFRSVEGWENSVDASVVSDAGERIKVTGGVILSPLAAKGVAEVTGVPLARYSAYIPDSLLIEVKDGVAGLSARFNYSADNDRPQARLSSLSFGLESFRMRKNGEKFDLAAVPELSVDDSVVDLIAREVSVGSFRTRDGRLGILRYENGDMNLLTLVEPGKPGEKQAKKPAGGGEEKKWTVRVADAALDGYRAQVEDLSRSTPVKMTLEDIKVWAAGFSTAKGEKGSASISFVLNKKGGLSSEGEFRVDPFYIGQNVDMKDLDIHTPQPFYTDGTGVRVKDGYVSGKGRFEASRAEDGSMSYGYRGGVSVTRFASVDKKSSNDLFNFKSFYVKGIEMSSGPANTDVRIDEVALSDFYSRIIVNEDGTLNLRTVASPEGEAGAKDAVGGPDARAAGGPAKPDRKPPPFTAQVARVTLQGGHVNFADRSIKPGFSSDLTEVAGRVSGLSSDKTKLADVDLKAVYNDYAPIDIKGRINPLSKELYVDLEAKFTGADLTPLTPYSGKYIGYTIKKGKLSLDIDYLIDGRKLDSRNVVFVDQLTLGDKVDSPDATKLPVKLAIALLKDRNGEIHIDLPMTGNIDDPKFSIGGLVVQVLLNIVVKAATSPFALLGSLLGGGEELGYIEFAYGRDVVDDEGMAKLDKIATALYERPALKMSIEGYADPEKDVEGLKTYLFERKVKAKKLEQIMDDGGPAVELDEVVVAPEEYDEFLEEAYDDEDFPKPRNFLGFAKSLPPAEMEKLMITNIIVTGEDLAELAEKRAANVRKRLLASGDVDAGRVFMTRPPALAPEEKEGVKASRVEFVME